MTTTTSPLASAGTSVARREDKPLVWNRAKVTFVSTCPKCGQDRSQHGYTRRILLSMLNRRSKIDAYCIECNVCWPISESERRAISPTVNVKLPKCDRVASTWCSQRRAPHRSYPHSDQAAAESHFSLQQALGILCGIRLRYEIDRSNTEVPFRSMMVALSCTDMLWVTAAIEALEKAIAASAIEAAERAAQALTES